MLWPTFDKLTLFFEFTTTIMFKNGMRTIHPGEVLLEDYIKPMKISVQALSIALDVPYSRLLKIVDGNRGVSVDTALRLELYFGSEAQGWLALQAAYDLRIAENQSAKIITREASGQTDTQDLTSHSNVRMISEVYDRLAVKKAKPVQ